MSINPYQSPAAECLPYHDGEDMHPVLGAMLGCAMLPLTWWFIPLFAIGLFAVSLQWQEHWHYKVQDFLVCLGVLAAWAAMTAIGLTLFWSLTT